MDKASFINDVIGYMGRDVNRGWTPLGNADSVQPMVGNKKIDGENEKFPEKFFR